MTCGVTLRAGLAMLVTLCAGSAAQAADRTPIAVLWMGELDGELGAKIVDDVNAALARKQSARPIDGAEDRRVLAEGGPVAKATSQVRAGEAALARGKLTDAVAAFEAAEAQLLAEAPFESLRSHLAEVERGRADR
jgi:hypothetical protein